MGQDTDRGPPANLYAPADLTRPLWQFVMDYTAVVYWTFRGRVRLDPHSY